MKETRINFGAVDVAITKGSYGSRITIYRDGKETILNCTQSEMLRFLTDSIDLLMEFRK